MEYWQGIMNWSIVGNWKCEICGENKGLTWGIVNGMCRCNNCHTTYMMRIGDKIINIPKIRIKPEYLKAVKKAWNEENIFVDKMDFNEEEWKKYGAQI